VNQLRAVVGAITIVKEGGLRMYRIDIRSVLPVLFVAFFCCDASLFAQPAVSFDQTAFVVSGITPGAQALSYSVTHDPQPYTMRVVERIRVLGPAAPGIALRDQLGSAPRRNSIWAAIDLGNAETTFAAPGGRQVRHANLPAQTLHVRPDGTPQITCTGDSLTLLYIRPHAGVWIMNANDGADSDDDGRPDAVVTASLVNFKALGGSPSPPATYRGGDRIIAINHITLEVFEFRVAN